MQVTQSQLIPLFFFYKQSLFVAALNIRLVLLLHIIQEVSPNGDCFVHTYFYLLLPSGQAQNHLYRRLAKMPLLLSSYNDFPFTLHTPSRLSGETL